MVTIADGSRVLYMGGALVSQPNDVFSKTTYELKSDLSGWEERPELALPSEMAWIQGASYDY